MAATKNGHYGAVDLLLQHGANLDIQDDVRLLIGSFQ